LVAVVVAASQDDRDTKAGVIDGTYGGPAFRGLRASSTDASRRMARTGRRDTKPELELRRALFARGLRYRVDASVLPSIRRRPDIVFRGAKVAVFVDGCFWHGCPDHATWPKANGDFWREKISTNRLRDRDTDQRLTEAGWLVVRIWEHEDAGTAADQLEKIVCERRGH
jgi:DNA mismatch endonuclease, patch repair protein